MFDPFKKAFGASANKPEKRAFAASDVVSAWAEAQGFAYSRPTEGKVFSIAGRIGNKPWRLERSHSSRAYIQGDELRARAELKVDEDVAVLIMNRSLKEALEKQAYALYTDTLQTTVDPKLGEEMRWLAMYREVGWEGLGPAFWARYSVLADKRAHALAWLEPSLADALMSWPEPAPDAQVPFVLMLLRGKGYLRMQYTPADMPTLAHTTLIFTRACESALAGLEPDISL
ncbi:MAG: hypothetical protein EAZ34_04150 [Polaromonas sp.]|nr:MAG: hypothetical protein EAZ34_04150 [Polaromonas sp.]